MIYNSMMQGEERYTQNVVLLNSPEVNISDLHLEEIPNDLKANPNSSCYPYNCIGLLKFTNPHKDNTLNGTAFLIAPDLVVTCAHNLYSQTDNCYYTDVEFYPSTSQKDPPPHRARLTRVTPQFKKGSSRENTRQFDIGMVKLARPVVREQYLEIKYNFKIERSEIFIYGFPKPLKEKRLFGREGKLVGLLDSIGHHSISTEAGQDGSPLLIIDRERWHVVGVHLDCGARANEALMISKSTMVTLCKWEREMMQSQIEFSQYAQMQEPRKEQFIFDFGVNEYDKDISRNLQPRLNLNWKIPSVNQGKLSVKNGRISRVKTGLLDDTHKQCVSLEYLPRRGVYKVKFRVMKYGDSDSPDSVYFGLATERCKDFTVNNGRQRQSLAYCCIPGSFNEKGKGRGCVLMQGRQMAYGEELYLREGGQLLMEINMNDHCLLWSNGRREVSHRLSKVFRNNPVHLFVALATSGSCVSWCTLDQAIWQ